MSAEITEDSQRGTTMSKFAQLFHKPSEQLPATEFIGGFFPRKHVSVLAAKAGTGKTWFILKLLTDLSRGGTIFNGMSYYEPQRKCILFCGETGLELVSERQRSMKDKAVDTNFVVVSRTEAQRKGVVIDISTREGSLPIFEMSKDFQADVIVLDTLMSFRSDDENTMVNSNLMMMNLKSIAETLNCAVIVTHHVRKRQGDKQRIDQDEIVGSSAIVRQCGAAFILSRQGYNYALKPVKSWWELPNVYEYRMEKEFGLVTFTEPSWTEETNITERRLKVERFLKSLQDDETITVTELCEHFKVSKPTARYALDKFCTLVKEGQGTAGAVYMKKSSVS